MEQAKIIKISSSLVVASGMADALMHGLVKVGHERLTGEIIELRGDKAWIQVYEETSGVAVGEPVVSLGKLLSVQLGPGLLSSIYDGIQRPLSRLAIASGSFIARGLDVPQLDVDQKWHFVATVDQGQELAPGDVLGTVQETETINHKIMVPPGMQGKVKKIAKEGDYTVVETVCVLTDGDNEYEIQMMQEWPVRIPRPVKERLVPIEPLITGTRVLDTFFPLAKGGVANIPGPFGAGKTVTQQQIAKWANADVVVYVGCGERGNEMTDVLAEFPELKDPRNGRPLMERTVLVANTSNMPIAAREASIYTGITIAEYYRDMGYDVALMADSTSRWAEALREMSGRLEEMPGEEGYPAYLASRIAQFYERAGRVLPLGADLSAGSVTAIGAISPPGGDLSEPVSQGSLQVTKVFWSLDRSLAYSRHYPAINWLTSYSLYTDVMEDYYAEHVDADYPAMRQEAMQILERESELLEVIKIVGTDSLSDADRLTLEIAESLREDLMQQFAFDEVDSFSSLRKQILLLKAILTYYHSVVELIDGTEGIDLSGLFGGDIRTALAQVKTTVTEDELSKLEKLITSIPEDVHAFARRTTHQTDVDLANTTPTL